MHIDRKMQKEKRYQQILENALYEALIDIGCQEMGNWNPIGACEPFAILKEAMESIFTAIEGNPDFCKMFIFMDQANRSYEISEQVNKRLSEQDIVIRTVPLIRKAQEAGQVKKLMPGLCLWHFGVQ